MQRLLSPSFRRLIRLIAVANLLLLTHQKCLASDDDGSSSVTTTDAKCMTEEDLDFDSCNLEDLPEEALVDICVRVGLDVEQHVFPILTGTTYLDGHDDDDDGNDGATEDQALGQDYGDNDKRKRKKKVRQKEDYVRAAYECLMIEDEVDRMEEEDPDGLEELERSMLAEDPGLLADVVKDVLENNPTLLEDLEAELKKEDPGLYNDLMEELADGETFADRPELVADLVSLMLAESPDILETVNTIDEDIAEHMRIEKAAEDESDEGEGTGTSDEL